jgi:hypothetical protein
MKRSLLAFVVSAAATCVLGASTRSLAATWYRTIEGSACEPIPNTDLDTPPFPYIFRCGFPSDQIVGATSVGGNGGVSRIYADYAIEDTPATYVNITACGTSYNLSAGSCGAPTSFPSQNVGVYDQSLALWTGTSSAWDYFYVELSMRDGAGHMRVIGIGVTGAN